MQSAGPSDGPEYPVVELEFAITDASYPFVAATTDGTCAIELAEMIPRQGGAYAEFFNVTGASTERILELTDDYETIDASLLREYDDGGLFEFVTTGKCPAVSLAKLGALPREAVSVDGEGRIVAEIPPEYETSAIIKQFLAENPEAELVSKRERASFSPLLPDAAREESLLARLTDRQREVLRAAFDAGYYEWPRQCSGTDVAEDLDISSATFSEHIHAAERKILSALLDGSSRGDG